MRFVALTTLSLVAVAGVTVAMPAHVMAALRSVIDGLIAVTPLVIPGILLSAWINASGANGNIARFFGGHMMQAIVVASLVGAITPVCGVTVLPLMTGLLAGGVPLAPVMAFWLSSPVTDPAMLAATVATLGLPFAIGKTVAAFALGVAGGGACLLFGKRGWSLEPLRRNTLVGDIGQSGCCHTSGYRPAVWRTAEQRSMFRREVLATTRLILICLIPAFAAEYALNELLQPDSLAVYVGASNWWGVPLAVVVGAPAYLDGYAALPLTRGLMEHGMSPGAALAFLVSGGVVSVWGAMAIFPVLRLQPFLLYMAIAVGGSIAVGWIFNVFV